MRADFQAGGLRASHRGPALGVRVAAVDRFEDVVVDRLDPEFDATGSTGVGAQAAAHDHRRFLGELLERLPVLGGDVLEAGHALHVARPVADHLAGPDR